MRSPRRHLPLFLLLTITLGVAGCGSWPVWPGAASTSGANNQWVGFSLADGWRVEITAQGMQLSTDDTEDGRQLAVISEQLPDGTMGFRGVHDQGLELWLYPGGCIERSTGDYYHLTSVLVRDGQRLNGCGYQAGSQAPR